VSLTVFWFRNDLRLADNPAFVSACDASQTLLPMVTHDPQIFMHTPWGFVREGQHRRRFFQESILDLRSQLEQAGSGLWEFYGNPADIFMSLAYQYGALTIYTQEIEAPEEKAQIQILKNLGIKVHTFWQSSMLEPNDLPFALTSMPDVFSLFRKSIEAENLYAADPLSIPRMIPPPPADTPSSACNHQTRYGRSGDRLFSGGTTAGLAHVHSYFLRRLPDTYKQTRNQIIGFDASSKFSPWLAMGCVSARQIARDLKAYESHYGANEGTYWLWFELLWRDYFQFLATKYGISLFNARGLSHEPVNRNSPYALEQWTTGETNEPFINAGMKELSETGFLSNRMRQIVASYWIYDMHGDWRQGAAWFESQLMDFDVYSNQGNWLYIAGRGTDPRGGRHFNVGKQMNEHDPLGMYRKRWLG
jgi:deoxyribodipyrimidine photo-lyase